MAVVTGDDYTDLCEWAGIIARDAALRALDNKELGLTVVAGPSVSPEVVAQRTTHLLALIQEDAAGSFGDLLTNHYGED